MNDMLKNDLLDMLKITFLVLIASLIIFGYLWKNIQFSVLKYENQKLAEKKRTVFLEVENLKIKAAKYSTASRIEKLFKEKYGYVPIQISQKIISLQLPKIKILKDK